MKPSHFAIIGEQLVEVEALRCRKTDRTARVLANGVEVGVSTSLLFSTETDAKAAMPVGGSTRTRSRRARTGAKGLGDRHASREGF